jgi:hypothetical protein
MIPYQEWIALSISKVPRMRLLLRHLVLPGPSLAAGTLLALLWAGMSGCGAPASYDMPSYSAPSGGEFVPSDDGSSLAFQHAAESSQENGLETSPTESPSESSRLSRKLIQTADVNLVVEDFDTVPQRIESLVERHGGFISDSRLGGQRGARRTGTWQVRVPSEQFKSFLGAAAGIGEIRSMTQSARDVTEEFVDVEARIRNKRVQEEGLLRILAERPGKLEDVLAVERELSRVREEMERMQGRLRLLSSLTSLATITISVEEIKGYVPAESPTLARRVTRSFEGSLIALRQTGEALLVTLAALAPWFIVLGMLSLPTWWCLRRCVPWLYRREDEGKHS